MDILAVVADTGVLTLGAALLGVIATLVTNLFKDSSTSKRTSVVIMLVVNAALAAGAHFIPAVQDFLNIDVENLVGQVLASFAAYEALLKPMFGKEFGPTATLIIDFFRRITNSEDAENVDTDTPDADADVDEDAITEAVALLTGSPVELIEAKSLSEFLDSVEPYDPGTDDPEDYGLDDVE